MRRFYLIGFTMLMVLDTLSQVSFKLAGNHALPMASDLAWLIRVFSAPWIYGAVACYLGAFVTWMTLLKHAPVGPAFAASHLEIVSVLILSYFLFDERLSLMQLAGSAVIIAGIVCLAMSETDAAPS